MRKRKAWKCDYKGCEELAQWYRKLRRDLLKLCTRHEAYFAREHWGRSVNPSDLDEGDIRYLEGKERKKESAKKEPFEVALFSLEDGTKVRIRDRQTGEKRSFIIKDTDLGGLFESYDDLQREKISKKLSIDEFIERLRSSL